MAQQTGSRLARQIDFKGVPLIAVTYDSDARKALNFRDSAFKHANPPGTVTSVLYFFWDNWKVAWGCRILYTAQTLRKMRYCFLSIR